MVFFHTVLANNRLVLPGLLAAAEIKNADHISKVARH
jgi:hypothetical protein